MDRCTVTFTRVFDVVRQDPGVLSRSRKVKTSFGFEGAQGRHLNVSVPGLPRVESGMTVTALLLKHGDWHSMVGWIDHATGEVVGPRMIDALTFLVPVFGCGAGAIAAGVSGNWFGALFMSALCAGALHLLLQTRHAVRELEALRADMLHH